MPCRSVGFNENLTCVITSVSHYSELYQDYQNSTGAKNWNFPKIHSHQHGTDDIEAKGVTANYNTKPYEKMHGSSKKTYLRCTNKRNVAPQVMIRLANSH